MRFRTFVFGSLSIPVLLTAGCGGGGQAGSSPSATAFVSPTGKILPFTKVQATKVGTTFYIVLDRPGGRVIAPIKLSGTVDESSARQIIFTIANQPVGGGDAGSLIIDHLGNSVGALSAGFGSTNNIFQATAIEDEQSTLLAGPSTKKPTANAVAASNNGLKRIVRGVSPYIWSIISKDPRSTLAKLFTLDTSVPPKSVSKDIAKKGTSYSSTIFMVSSYGDAVTAFTTGTVTTPYLGKLLCYGHFLDWEGGSQSIPCFYGSVLDFIVDPVYGSSKLAYPDFSKSAGTLIDDRRFGVVVDPTVTATPIPVTGTVTFNANAPVTFKGYVAPELTVETDLVLSNVAQGTSNVVDASEIAGSASGSATVNYADGTSQTVDLTDSGSAALIQDLFVNIEGALYDPTTFAPIPLASVTFNFVITTTAPPVHRTPHAGR